MQLNAFKAKLNHEVDKPHRAPLRSKWRAELDDACPLATEQSADVPVFEAETGEPHIFDLQFNIFYTPHDTVAVPVRTYVRPYKTEEQDDLMSPRQPAAWPDNVMNRDSDVQSKPMFIYKLTSFYLYQEASKAIEKSYKASNYLKNNKIVPLAVQTKSN